MLRELERTGEGWLTTSSPLLSTWTGLALESLDSLEKDQTTLLLTAPAFAAARTEIATSLLLLREHATSSRFPFVSKILS